MKYYCLYYSTYNFTIYCWVLSIIKNTLYWCNRYFNMKQQNNPIEWYAFKMTVCPYCLCYSSYNFTIYCCCITDIKRRRQGIFVPVSNAIITTKYILFSDRGYFIMVIYIRFSKLHLTGRIQKVPVFCFATYSTIPCLNKRLNNDIFSSSPQHSNDWMILPFKYVILWKFSCSCRRSIDFSSTNYVLLRKSHDFKTANAVWSRLNNTNTEEL